MKKKILLICLFLVGISAVSRAQGGMRMSAADRAKQMQSQLKLTDDQTAKITAIYQSQSAKVDSLRTAGAGREAIRPIMQAGNDKVKALLTPEQAVAFQKMIDERRARMQNSGGGSSSN